MPIANLNIILTQNKLTIIINNNKNKIMQLLFPCLHVLENTIIYIFVSFIMFLIKAHRIFSLVRLQCTLCTCLPHSSYHTTRGRSRSVSPLQVFYSGLRFIITETRCNAILRLTVQDINVDRLSLWGSITAAGLKFLAMYGAKNS